MADQQDTGGGRHRRPEDGQAMDGMEYPTPKFHTVTVTGDDGGNMLTVVELANDAEFLGEPPAAEGDLTPRGFHRFDSGRVGYYSGEREAFQR